MAEVRYNNNRATLGVTNPDNLKMSIEGANKNVSIIENKATNETLAVISTGEGNVVQTQITKVDLNAASFDPTKLVGTIYTDRDGYGKGQGAEKRVGALELKDELRKELADAVAAAKRAKAEQAPSVTSPNPSPTPNTPQSTTPPTPKPEATPPSNEKPRERNESGTRREKKDKDAPPPVQDVKVEIDPTAKARMEAKAQQTLAQAPLATPAATTAVQSEITRRLHLGENVADSVKVYDAANIKDETAKEAKRQMGILAKNFRDEVPGASPKVLAPMDSLKLIRTIEKESNIRRKRDGTDNVEPEKSPLIEANLARYGVPGSSPLNSGRAWGLVDAQGDMSEAAAATPFFKYLTEVDPATGKTRAEQHGFSVYSKVHKTSTGERTSWFLVYTGDADITERLSKQRR
jgi:hypothetical protein